jgi:multiple sugar transport system permease protein
MKKIQNSLIYILLSLAAIFMLFPFLWMLMNSFNTESSIFKVPPNLIPDLLFTPRMFENYQQVLGTFHFGRYTLNSFMVAGTSAMGQVLTCSLAGFTFAMMKFRGRNVLFALLLGTMMIPVQVTIIPEFILMMKINWLDTYLPLIVPSLLLGSFGTFMYKEFFENVPSSLLDAGAVDGAGAFTIYFKLYLPQSQSQAATLFIIAFMNNWNDLLRPILYISSEKLMTVTMALTQFQSQYTAKWNLLLTGGVLSILPLLALYIFLQKYIIEGISSTGAKG